MKSSSEPAAARAPSIAGGGFGRVPGLLLALLLVLLLLRGESELEVGLRHAVFDAYQREFPRERINDSVIVMAIDDLSLQRRGQWPWPRKDLAELIDRLAAQQPAAIGIDMFFPEPDRLSPRTQALHLEKQGYVSADRPASKLPDYDQMLAQSLKKAGVALGIAGLLADERIDDAVDYRAPLVEIGGPATPHVPSFPNVLRSVDPIDRAAAGHGAVNALDDRGGVVRSLPALAHIGGFLVPGLAVETLRQVSTDPVLRVIVEDSGVRRIEVGGHAIPTSPDGSWWIHFSDPEARPIFPVVSFLDGTLPTELIRGRIVLVGAAASGLQDRVMTPVGAMPGVSVHAEALDNLLDGRLLWRPYWATWAECGLLVALALASILAVPALRPLQSLLMFGAAALLTAALGALAFLWRGWLIDVASPTAAAALVFALMLTLALGQTQRQRRTLAVELGVSRERQARIEGELDAARRIQSGMLPDPARVLAGESRLDLHALMHPAREVGGDLYDFFRLDDGRVFFMVGDVSGKGLPASLFMALSKALIKSAALRADGDPGRALSEAGRALARENPEAMFVSVAAGVLNPQSGELRWCSAGHDAPLLVRSGDTLPLALKTAGGPPLCMLDSFDYPTERMQLAPGDLLCLITDGITEAHNAREELYGAKRLEAGLGAAAAEANSRKIVERLRRDVEKFSAGLEPADDLTILVLRWTPRASR